VDISRREFLQLMGGVGGAPALTGLIASGVSLAPTVARAQALRIKDAKTTPSVCPYCSVGCATLEIEFNHIQQKLMRGLGIVAIENQARI
jgi:formate dehydrogenase major subunit